MRELDEVYKCQDVKYEIEQRGPVPVGSEFTVVVRAQNYSRDERTVNITLTIVAVHYTGVTRNKLRGEIFNFNLCSLRRTYMMYARTFHYSYTRIFLARVAHS